MLKRGHQSGFRTWKHQALGGVTSDDPAHDIDIVGTCWTNRHAAPPNCVLPTRTFTTPPSSAVLTARSLGSIPPETKSADRRDPTSVTWPKTPPEASLTPRTSVIKTSRVAPTLTATAAAVSSPLMLSSECSPHPSVGTTGIFPATVNAIKVSASATTLVPTSPHGPFFFCA